MLVDSGAATTVISERDASLLEIDYTLLKRGEDFTGVGGSVCNYLLNDVSLSFKLEDEKFHIEKVESVSLMRHKKYEEKCPECGHEWIPRGEEKSALAFMLPSLLGVSVISRFKVRYTKTKIFLER